MQNKATIIFIIIFVIAVAGVSVYGLTQENKVDNNNSLSSETKIYITPAFYDFGEVSQKEGVVTTSFTLKNSGTSDLVIDDMVSSCSCTTATLIISGQEGPRFGMHGNPKNWSETLTPGQEAELKVYYDPNVHKDFKGAATREITIFSNDQDSPEKSVKITLNQID